MKLALLTFSFGVCLASPLTPDASGPLDGTPEDREAARLVEDLERAGGVGRSRALSRILERRLPQTVPALCVLLTDKERKEIHDVMCEEIHCGLFPGRPLRDDPFEKALCLSTYDGLYPGQGLKRRGCCIIVDEGMEFLKSIDTPGHPWLRLIALLRRERAGDPFCIPGLLGWSSLGSGGHPWTGPVARWLRSAYSVRAVCERVLSRDLQAYMAAIATGNRQAVSGVLASWEGPPPRRRPMNEDTVWFLGEMRDRRAVPLLLHELKEGDYWSKADAAEALGKIGDPSILPDLVAAVEGETAWTQVHLFEAIGRLGGVEEIPLLTKFAESTEYTGAIARARCARRAIETLRARVGR